MAKQLATGNETNGRIFADTLINDEGRILVYDVLLTQIEQVGSRAMQMETQGMPNDMNESIASIVHCAPKLLDC